MGCLGLCFYILGYLYGIFGFFGGLIDLFQNPVAGLLTWVVAGVLFFSCTFLGRILGESKPDEVSGRTWILISISLLGFVVVGLGILANMSAAPQVCMGFSNPNCGGTGDQAAMAQAKVVVIIGTVAHVLGLIGAAISSSSDA